MALCCTELCKPRLCRFQEGLRSSAHCQGPAQRGPLHQRQLHHLMLLCFAQGTLLVGVALPLLQAALCTHCLVVAAANCNILQWEKNFGEASSQRLSS